MEIQNERKVEGPCSFPCSLSSLLTLNCRARAEGLARRLQTNVVKKNPSTGLEGTLLVESNDKVRLTTSEGRPYSLDDHNINTFKTTVEPKTHRPIHVVTSEPTLHLSLPPQPTGVDDIGAGSPSEQEQDSDVYYDFDLVTPPEDYACTGESRMATKEIISEESEKPERPESGCVTSVTSPIMFAGGNYSLPPSNPPSPHEDCPPELLNSRASEIDLNAIRQLLVSSKLRSLCTMSDTERPFTVTDSMRPDFVGVVRAGSENLSATPSDKSSSFDRSSSDEGELIVPIHEEEKTLVLSEEDVTCNSSFYLPPPSSYQIFSNRESCVDSIEMPSTSARKQTKASKRRVKKKKPCAHNSNVSESSDSRESETHDREFPLTRVGEKIFTLENLSQRHKCSYKQDFHRSHSGEWFQEAKTPKMSQSSKSVEEYTDEVLSDSTPNDPMLFPSDTGDDSIRENAPLIKSKGRGKMFSYLVYNSSNESISSPEDKSMTPFTCINDIGAFQSIIPTADNTEEPSEMSSRGEHHLTEQQQLESTLLNEDLVLREIDDAISLLKKESEDIVGKKSAISEEKDSETLALGSIERGMCPEQVAGSHFGSAFDAQNECQQFVPGSERCELCEEAVPFLSFKNEFGEGIGDLITGDSTCPSFRNIENTPSELSKLLAEKEMHKSKGRVKVKRGSAETDLFLSGAELPEETASNLDLKFPQQDLINVKSNQNCDLQTYADKQHQSVITRDGVCSSAAAKENCVCSNEEKILISDKSRVSNSREFVEYSSEDINMHKSKSKFDKNSTENYNDTSFEATNLAKQFVSKDERSQNKSDEQLPLQDVADGQESKYDENYGISSQAVSTKMSKMQPSLDETSRMPQTNPDWPWSRRRRFKNSGFSPSNHDGGKTLSPQSDSTSFINNNQSLENSRQDEHLYHISASPKLCLNREEVPSPVSKEVDSHTNEAESNNTMTLANESSCSNEANLFFDYSATLQTDETDKAVDSSLCDDLKGRNNETNVAFVKSSEFNRGVLLSVDSEFHSRKKEIHETSTQGEIENTSDKITESTFNTPDLNKVSVDEDELIESLPEKSLDDDEVTTEDELEDQDADSDDEPIITGRFKNLTKYTEKVIPSSDDGLPPPPMEVILVDYNESLEVNPEEDTPVTEDIGKDLASELNRLQTDEPAIQHPSDESERSSQEREMDIDRQQRIKRSSSLRCGKTPPGTPGRKKIVRFADCLGLDLADIRTFLDGVPNVPPSAFCDLEVEEDNAADGSGHSSLPSYGSYSAAASAAAAILENQARRILTPMFQQPGALPDFYDRLREQKVILENVSIGVDLSVKGVVRVINESYHKKVFIRYTFDHWKNFHEATATYMDGSCDGLSDRFSFLLWGSFLQSNGSLIFCVKFCVNDKQYWDNNRGANYYLHCYSTQPQNLPLSNSKIPPLDGRPQNHCNIHQQHHTQEQRAPFSLHHGGSSFLDTPTTPSDPWISRFF